MMARPRIRTFALLIVLVTCGGSTATGAAPRVAAGAVTEAPMCALPVEATVSDGFRPPAEPWLPGNRGLTFATAPGEPVHAVVAGIVSYAGAIAHQWYVTVDLADGRDVTYSFLSSVDVAAGDVVASGDPIGVTGSVAFQLGYRDGPEYLDPTGLVADACGLHHAVLVPVPE